jgi:hypothetical protein
MELIDILHSIAAIVFFLAALDKLKHTKQEHFYTRIIAAAWFLFTVIYHDMPVLLVRVVSNCVIIAIPMTEIASPKFTKYWRRK